MATCSWLWPVILIVGSLYVSTDTNGPNVTESRKLLQHPWLPVFADEVARFHSLLHELLADFANPSLSARISDEQFLQGPLADAMTHVGQLAMLRRLAGAPVPAEDFVYARIDSGNVSAEQPMPVAPDPRWSPDVPPQPPG